MLDVITIGTATRDIFISSPNFKVLRDPEHLKRIGAVNGEAQVFAMGAKIEIDKPIFTSGGGATNAAVTFARQGFKTGAVIKVGDDEPGRDIVLELKMEGVVAFAAIDRKLPTGYDTILLSHNGERTILVYLGAAGEVAARDIPFKKLKSKWAYIAPGRTPYELLDHLVNHLYKSGVNIAINPSKHLIERKVHGLKNILTKAKVVIVNREEAAYLTGIGFEYEKRIFKALDQAIPGIAVMTDGGRGAHVSDGSYVWSAGIFREKEMVDRTGAGDAFGSGFVSGLMRYEEECRKGLCSHLAIEYAIRLASANATSMVESIGAKSGILTRHEFERSPRWRHLPVKTTRL